MCNNCATAPIEAPTTGTTPDSPSNFNNVGSENNQTRVIVGVVIGLLFILVLGVAIVVFVLYLVRCGKTGGKFSTANSDTGLGKYP